MPNGINIQPKNFLINGSKYLNRLNPRVNHSPNRISLSGVSASLLNSGQSELWKLLIEAGSNSNIARIAIKALASRVMVATAKIGHKIKRWVLSLSLFQAESN